MEYVTSADGTRIAYDVDGDGPPLVLVHGTSANHRCWEAVRPALEEEYTVYAMDRRGRGESGDADAYHIEREFEDVVAVVEAVGDDVNLVGHSYGALSSLGALPRTDAVHKVVLNEPPLWTEHKPVAPEEALAKMDEQVEDADREGVLETFYIDVAQSEDRLEYYRTLDTWDMRLDAALTIPREVRGTDAFRPEPEEYADVDVPARVLLGTETGGHLPHGTRKASELLPNAELVELEGVDHAVIYAEPDVFNEVVLDFLAD